MGWRGTATLFLLTVVVGVYLWFEDAPPKQTEDPTTLLGEPREVAPTPPLHRLFDFQPAAVVAIQLERAGTTRHTERTGETWNGVADPRSINDFLANIVDLGALAEIPAAPEDLKDYGLAPPRTVLQLSLRDRSGPLVVQVGDRNPATTGVYVRIGDSGPVLLAGALVAWEVDKAFKALAPAGDGD